MMGKLPLKLLQDREGSTHEDVAQSIANDPLRRCSDFRALLSAATCNSHAGQLSTIGSSCAHRQLHWQVYAGAHQRGGKPPLRWSRLLWSEPRLAARGAAAAAVGVGGGCAVEAAPKLPGAPALALPSDPPSACGGINACLELPCSITGCTTLWGSHCFSHPAFKDGGYEDKDIVGKGRKRLACSTARERQAFLNPTQGYVIKGHDFTEHMGTVVHTWQLPDWLAEVRGCSACQRSSLALRSSSSLLSISRIRTSRLSCFTAATSSGSMPSVLTAPKQLVMLRDWSTELPWRLILQNSRLATVHPQRCRLATVHQRDQTCLIAARCHRSKHPCFAVQGCLDLWHLAAIKSEFLCK